MKARELITERQDPRQEIENMATILPGDIDEYFVRFTDQPRIGFSTHQHYGRIRDVNDPEYDANALYDPKGRRALWFYPLSYYLKQRESGVFATEYPYLWLVRLKPTAWLQPEGRLSRKTPPAGKTRVGYLKSDAGVPMAVFFQPAFDVVDRWMIRQPRIR